MKFKIVADSSCDLNKELRERLNIDLVPLTIEIDGKRYSDDKNLNLDRMMEEMKESKDCPRTSCPSPQDFIEGFKGEEDIFAVTISSALSGTYNSAVLAKDLMLDEVMGKFIYVFDTLSASVGETLVSMKILEVAKNNYDKLQVVEKVNEYIKEMKTYFVLDSLDNLIKAGRMNLLKGKVASLLSIKPILKGNENGEIEKVDSVRGKKKAMKRLVEVIGEYGEKLEEKVLGIGHCRCFEKAVKLKKEIMKRYDFKEIVIVEMGGLSSVYANQGGIVIAF